MTDSLKETMGSSTWGKVEWHWGQWCSRSQSSFWELTSTIKCSDFSSLWL